MPNQLSPQMLLRTLIGFVALALHGFAAFAEPIRFGSLSLDWPSGYTVKSTQVPFELAGPDGVKVLVTIMRIGKEASIESTATDFDKLVNMNEKFLTSQARKAGTVVVNLSLEQLPDGSTLQFIGSEVSRAFRTGYFLQYMVVNQGGRLGFVTFEGNGDATKQHESLKPLFQSVQWVP